MKTWRRLLEKYPQIFDSLWLFPRRGEGGDGGFHGNFIPQVAEYLMLRYTNPGDWVWDPLAGSGTSGDVAEKIGRNCLMTDLTPTRDDIYQANACYVRVLSTDDGPQVLGEGDRATKLTDIDWEYQTEEWRWKVFKLVILHPPYWDIIRFSDDPSDLSNVKYLTQYLGRLGEIKLTVCNHLIDGGYVALVMGDIYKDGEVLPLSYWAAELWVEDPFYSLKAIYIKDIQGNLQNRGQNENLWNARHHRNGTNRFAHETIFVFQVEGN